MKPSENAVQVNEVAADLYTITVEVRTTDGDLVFADQNLAMQVYGGINNVITGDLIEGLSEDNYFAEPVHERDVQNDPNALTGVFSVAANKQVQFSKGNLYYDGSEWGFEDNQYDFRTWEANDAIKDGVYSETGTESGNVGLFYWTKDTAKSYLVEYDSSGRSSEDTFFANNNADVMGEEWFALSYDELYYLFDTRADASNKRGIATVNTGSISILGVVLLPDSWTLPDGCSWTAGDSLEWEGMEWTINSYTAEQWAAMESAGAVFMPAMGHRDVTEASYVRYQGEYWLSSLESSASEIAANEVIFCEDGVFLGGSSDRSNAISIRLVTLAQ
jgi:hypothetical protein